MKNRAWRRYVLIAALTAVYVGAGKFGLDFFGLLHPSASPVWLPTGIAIAALLLFGYTVWPAVLVGAFLVNVTTAGSVATSVGVASGNTLEALLAVYLVNRFASGKDAFARAPDILRFAGLAALLSTIVSATVGVGSLTLGGYASVEQFGAIWFTWWLGDAAGAMVVTPLLLLWYLDHRLTWTPARLWEGLLLLAAVVLTGLVIFFIPVIEPYPLAFLCIPVLVWAAFRFGQREAASAVAVLSALAIAGTVQDRGPFVMQTPNESLLVLQAFMAVMALTALPMAALGTERSRLLERERAARAQAEEANRAKDEFLAILGHELRNPLSAIGAATAVLDQLQEPDAGEAQRWRTIIRRQTEHLSRLIDDLLDIARVTAAKMSITRRPMDLGAAALHCARRLAPAHIAGMPRIEVRVQEAWISADMDRIEQIIDNLLRNAVKHTPPQGSVCVAVTLDGDAAVLSVEDTGAGIESDLLPRVFDAFVQGRQGLERPAGGLGVGLTLVRRLVELHSGRVEARSEGPGRGSVFTVRLPGIDRPLSDRADGIELRPLTDRACRILLVEDNADNRDAVAALLQHSGYDTHVAPDGEAGLAAALRLRPNVVLIDIGLPKLDGYEVARRLKAAVPGIRLVALTGYGREEDKARARQVGFDAHLVKPVSVGCLRDVIDELLDGSSLRQASSRAS